MKFKFNEDNVHACKNIEREMTLDTRLAATIEILK